MSITAPDESIDSWFLIAKLSNKGLAQLADRPIPKGDYISAPCLRLAFDWKRVVYKGLDRNK